MITKHSHTLAHTSTHTTHTTLTSFCSRDTHVIVSTLLRCFVVLPVELVMVYADMPCDVMSDSFFFFLS